MDVLFQLGSLYFSNKCVSMGLISEEKYYDSIIEKIESNGVVFIKIAQILSSRQRLNGGMAHLPGFREKLQNMQDKCFFYSNTVRPEFKYVSENPIAAGSICNVHLIHYDDAMAVIKTTHQDISEKIDDSLARIDTIRRTCRFFHLKHAMAKALNLLDLVDYASFLKKQLNLEKEGQNQDLLRTVFADIPIICIPQTYVTRPDYLIMEYIPGLKFPEFIEKNPVKQDEATTLIYCAFYKMVTKGIVHGDFHHGNFLFRLIDNKVHMTILDFGMMCEFSEEQKAILQTTFNFSVDEQTRNAYFIKFLHTIDERFKTMFPDDTPMMDVLNKINELEIYIPMELMTLLMTLQNVYIIISDLKKRKGAEFKTYIIDYAMECGLFDEF